MECQANTANSLFLQKIISMAELANTLRNVFSLSYQERKKTGPSGKRVCYFKKNAKSTGKKIVEMIEQIHVQV